MSWALSILGLGGRQGSGDGFQLENQLEVGPEGNDADMLITASQAVSNGHSITLFNFDVSSASKDGDLVTQCDKNYKIWNHPYVIKFVASRLMGEDSVSIATERVEPLKTQLPSLTPEEVCLGLHSVATVLEFFHKNGKFSHNNVSMDAIFVAPDGVWKLGRLECGRPFSANTVTEINRLSSLCNQESVPPETKTTKGAVNPSHARDMYGLGMLCSDLLPYMDGLDADLKGFESMVGDTLLHSDPSERPTASEFLTSSIFSHSFIEIYTFLRNMALKDEDEKCVFFSGLYERLRSLPEVLIARYLAKPLLSRFSMACKRSDVVLPHLLSPKTADNSGLVSPDLHTEFVTPLLVKLFSVHEYAVRELLLTNLQYYSALIPKETLQYFVLPEILQGLHDTCEDMVCQTLGALSHLVTVLGHEIVVGTPRQDIFLRDSLLQVKKPQHVGKSPRQPKSVDMKRLAIEERRQQRQDAREKRKLNRKPPSKGLQSNRSLDKEKVTSASQENCINIQNSGQNSHGGFGEGLPLANGTNDIQDSILVPAAEDNGATTPAGNGDPIQDDAAVQCDDDDDNNVDPDDGLQDGWEPFDDGLTGEESLDATQPGHVIGDHEDTLPSDHSSVSLQPPSTNRSSSKGSASPRTTPREGKAAPTRKAQGMKLVPKTVVKPRVASQSQTSVDRQQSFSHLDIKSMVKSPPKAPPSDNWFDEMEPVLDDLVKAGRSAVGPSQREIGPAAKDKPPIQGNIKSTGILSFEPDPGQNDEDGWGEEW